MSVKRVSRVVAAGALLAATVPAFADHDHWNRGYTYGPQPVQQVQYGQPVYEPQVYGPAPVYADPSYGQVYGQPAPVYGQPVYSGPVYPQPVPVYQAQHRHRRGANVVGAAAGGAIGAVLGSQIGDYRTRPAMTAVGAALGALLGSQF